jgi:hypothetical protein
MTQKIYGRAPAPEILVAHLGRSLRSFQSIPLPDGSHGFVAEPYERAHAARAEIAAETGVVLLPSLANPDAIGDELASPFAHLSITGEHTTRHVARALYGVAGAHLFDPET